VAAALLQKFQREINRTSDSDRMTRKRGLQKLLDDLPWKSAKEAAALEALFVAHLLVPLVAGVADPVEKCRELSLSLLQACFRVASPSLSSEVVLRVVRSLCERVGEVPFLEPAEELRLQVLELVAAVLQHPAAAAAYPQAADLVLAALAKALTDTFPSAKRAGAELVCKLAERVPRSMQMAFKSLLKPLVGNATHQHSKTRSITVQAVGMGLSCVAAGDYEALLKDPVLPLLARMAGDRSGATRKELAGMCRTLLCHRLRALGRGAIEATLPAPDARATTSSSSSSSGAGDKGVNWMGTGFGVGSDAVSVGADVQLSALLMVLVGDESEEVAAFARACLDDTAAAWAAATPHTAGPRGDDMDMDVDNAELALRAAVDVDDDDSAVAMSIVHGTATTTAADTGSGAVSGGDAVGFARAYLHPIAKVVAEGATEWTTDIRRRNLRGLEALIRLAGPATEAIVPQVRLLCCAVGWR